MKKIFALALAIVMMMAIALPVFADVADVDPADGVLQSHKYGELHKSSAAENQDNFDHMQIKYGVYQEYIVTIPADVNFGFLTETEIFEAKRTVSADNVIISGTEYLYISVNSEHTWQMFDQEGKSVPVDYFASLADNPKTEADTADAVIYSKTSPADCPILVVKHAAGNEGYDKVAKGSVEITFTTNGTAQEGTYLDTLTFTVAITEGHPFAQANND